MQSINNPIQPSVWFQFVVFNWMAAIHCAKTFWRHSIQQLNQTWLDGLTKLIILTNFGIHLAALVDLFYLINEFETEDIQFEWIKQIKSTAANEFMPKYYYNSISIVTRYTLSLYHIQSITHTVIINEI